MAGPHTWTNGAGTGVWGTAGNWSSAAVPASNEVVIFNGTSTTDCTDPTGQGAIDLNLLYIDAAYTGSIGSSGSPLTISADKVEMNGTGTLWYTDGNGTTDLFEVNNGTVTVAGATTTRLVVNKGIVEVTGTVTTLDTNSIGSRTTDSSVTVSSAATVGTINANGGVTQISTANAVAALNIGCGAVVFADNSSTITAETQWGGEVEHGPSGAQIVTTLTVFGGVNRLIPTGTLTVTASSAYTPARVTVGERVTLTANMAQYGDPSIKGPTGKAVGYS